MHMKLSSNMEMYLKTILRLGEAKKTVRVKAIADAMGITMPSVSEALRTLKSKGLVVHPSYGEVKLSAKGRRLAEGVNDRFEVLQRFLVDVLKVDEETAGTEACEIEHVVGPDTFERLTAYLDFLTYCQKDTSHIKEHFHEYLEWRLAGQTCPVCGMPAQCDSEKTSTE